MKKLLAALLVVVMVFTVSIPKQQASADALTVAMVSSGVLAIAKASGLNFVFSSADTQSVKDVIENRVNSFLAGRSLSEVFGDEVFRIVAGKLIIPAAAVTGITSLLADLVSKYNLQENASSPTVISVGMINGQAVYPYRAQSYPLEYPLTPFTANGMPSVDISISQDGSGKDLYTFTYYNVAGEAYGTESSSGYSVRNPKGYLITTGNGNNNLYLLAIFELYAKYVGWTTGIRNKLLPNSESYTAVGLSGQIPGTYDPPEGLNDLQSWEGTVTNAPDTNLDQLMEDIFDQSASGTLDVSGEVVDTPAEPQVSPVPTAAPGDIIGGLDTISGQLEGIDNTLTGVQEGVGEAVGQLEGINEGIGSISEALEVPTTSEANQLKLPDLRTLFPFCIPFDLYNIISAFSVEPQAPHVQIPFNIPRIGLEYTFDLDFSSFNSVAQVCRTMEFIAFAIGLAILTSKVIRW